MTVARDVSRDQFLSEIDQICFVSNIAWRAIDRSRSSRVRHELSAQVLTVASVMRTGSPFSGALREYNDRIERAAGDASAITSATLKLLGQVDGLYFHVSKDFILADIEGRVTYTLNGMGIIDHYLDERAIHVSRCDGASFSDVRHDLLFNGSQKKWAYACNLMKLSCSGTDTHLDGRLRQVIEHVKRIHQAYDVETQSLGDVFLRLIHAHGLVSE